jgi:hypothetical protein
MIKKIKLKESDLKKIIKTLLKEHYDKEKLYDKESVILRLKRGPKELRKYIKGLPDIPCTDNQGNVRNCTKIPEVIYIYFKGNY